MSLLSQIRLLLPLLEVIRNHLAAGEYAAFGSTIYGSPCIKARTERGGVIVSISENGLYAFDTASSLYTCDPHGAKDTIRDTVRQALNDAREEWA